LSEAKRSEAKKMKKGEITIIDMKLHRMAVLGAQI
tara:strand:+ start:239 stop:343 length:105 start_codon:yes stop_codon:yes gene_type:complete